jgi:hypothetical protein
MMGVGKSAEWLAGQAEGLGYNLHQCRLVHHKSHMTWPWLEPGPRCEKPATNCLSYGTAFVIVLVKFSFVCIKIAINYIMQMK